MSAEAPAPQQGQVINTQLTVERFTGVPTLVPIRGMDISFAPKETPLWKPGIMDSNGGLVAAHDPNKPVVHLLPVGDIKVFESQGYKDGSADVPLTGADSRGWFGGSHSRELAGVTVNAIARENGVKGRTVKNEHGEDMFTNNPFDDGDFLDMTGLIEQTPNGQQIQNVEAVTDVANGRLSTAILVKTIGKFQSNNGVLAWVTPDGKTQIAPSNRERMDRLTGLGYESSESVTVPHSNGESFDPNNYGNPAQTYANLEFADMKRRGETITPEQRHIRFGKLVVPAAFADVIKN